jgi:hypothetical protein
LPAAPRVGPERICVIRSRNVRDRKGSHGTGPGNATTCLEMDDRPLPPTALQRLRL